MNSKRTILIFAASFLFLVLSGQAGKSDEKKGSLNAGLSKIIITPDSPVMLYGYSSRKTLSEGVHDPLSARAVVFENNGKKVVLYPPI